MDINNEYIAGATLVIMAVIIALIFSSRSKISLDKDKFTIDSSKDSVARVEDVSGSSKVDVKSYPDRNTTVKNIKDNSDVTIR